MSWYHKLWPWGRAEREAEAKRIQQIEDGFRKELEAAYEKHGDLDDITKKLRKTRGEPEPVGG